MPRFEPWTPLPLLAVLVTGCLPPPGGRADRLVHSATVRAPAALGVTVEVPAAQLIAVDPAWGRIGRDGGLAVAVWFRGQPIPCRVVGGADGTLDPEDEIAFEVGQANRHSPWLTYHVVRPTGGDGELCRLIEARDEQRSLLDVAMGRTVGTVLGVHRPDDVGDPAALRRDTDYLVIAPRALVPALDPLLKHRRSRGHAVAVLTAEDLYDRLSDGNPDPEAIRAAVRAVWEHSQHRLRHLLLVGDVRDRYEPDVSAPTPVPTFYVPKVHYPGYSAAFELPTDHLYGVVDEAPRRPHEALPDARIAVGRFPVHDAAEAGAMARKIVAYESEEAGGPWQRRLAVFGGPANYGRIVDAVIERIATQMLNDEVPYDYDLSVLFAKADSPYAWPFDRLDERLVSDLEAGALFAAYFGHGLEQAFDYVAYRDRYYRFGQAEALQGLSIPAGRPVFLSFTCHTGAYDRGEGEPSLGEILALNSAGPVAVFASSRASHPYPNALYAQAFIDVFLRSRPRTLGEGILAMKRRLRERRLVLAEALVGQDPGELKAEHAALYNLLGDPATRLRYPRSLTLTAPGSVRAGDPIPISIRAPGGGEARVTLETERERLQHELVRPSRLEELPVEQAFAAMAANLPRALDKVLRRVELPLSGDSARLELRAPEESGSYVIKALVSGGHGGVAAGHVRIQVLRPR